MTQAIKVDGRLIEQAAELVRESDHEKVVAQALSELIRRHQKLQALLDLAGNVDFCDGYDHQVLRRTRFDDAKTELEASERR